MRHPSKLIPQLGFLTLALLVAPVGAQQSTTSPIEQFGYEIGSDYVLFNYTQLYDYWHKLAGESERMTVHDFGLTSEGRPQIMAIITSPENHRQIERYRDIAARLAHAQGVTEAEALELSRTGKAVVWIDGGLHATEVLGAQQLTELVYRMVTRDDPETLRILDDVILLAAHANPDGHDLVADWYMRHEDPLERTTSGVPVLYNKYAGHDNNRDFYMSELAETTNINRILYREWFPQIVYNHHQTGPQGTIMFAPPFRGPPNHNLDPLIITSIDAVGAAMHGRFVREGKGGTTMRSGASYSTWRNGGLRTTPYFKNMIGLLTETRGHPTPIEIPFLPSRQLPRGDIPLPIEPGVWHFRQAVEYSQTANMAVLDHASRHKDRLLFNIWRMGANSIERGSRDNWTILPFQIDAAATELKAARGESGDDDEASGSVDDYMRLLRDPAKRDARGYIISPDRGDFLTATKFINALLKNGVEVHRATADFQVAGADYAAGSYVVKAAQAFRPHVLDMFEAQHHPNDFAYPGGPPIAPYDNAGWTLAFQMGIEFDRVLDAFDGPFEVVGEDLVSAPRGRLIDGEGATGFIVEHINDAFRAVNRVLAAGGRVFWMHRSLTDDGVSYAEGSFYFSSGGGTRSILEEAAREFGLTFHGVSSSPTGGALELQRPRIALWDRYGGSMPSGWTRKILEQFEFDFAVVYASEIDRGELANEYDVLILEDGAVPPALSEGRSGRRGGRNREPAAESIPSEFRDRLGSLTIATTVPAILDFAEQGGTVIAIGSSASLAEHAGLPVSNHLTVDGRPLTNDEYYTPGSVHSLRIEHVSPLTYGLGAHADVMISHSLLFDLATDHEAQGVRRIGWFDTDQPLRSGWAWGQERMRGGTALMEVDHGDGKLFIFTPKITFRAQSHATFPLLFNGIFYGTSRRVAAQP